MTIEGGEMGDVALSIMRMKLANIKGATRMVFVVGKILLSVIVVNQSVVVSMVGCYPCDRVRYVFLMMNCGGRYSGRWVGLMVCSGEGSHIGNSLSS